MKILSVNILLPINCNGNLGEKVHVEGRVWEEGGFLLCLTRFRIDAVQAIQSEATQKSHKRADNFQIRLN